ncbi:MAG: Ig-like domain-containing protein [Pseudomonadota bacterium]
MRKNTAIALPESDPLLMRALEQRIVLDAALGETAQDTANETAHSNLAQAYANSVSDDQTAWAHAVALREFGQEDDEPGVLANTDPTLEIAFIAADIADLEGLIASLPSTVEIIVLEPEAHGTTDGLDQIANTLATRSQIDAIHIFSHGSSGVLNLGGGDLTLQTMTSDYQDSLAVIGAALSQSGDIHVYGCDFASGAAGQDAVEQLAQLTGADVAASTDKTGAASLGGDWDLETRTGSIESESLAANPSWTGVLASQIVVSNDAALEDVDHDENIENDEAVGQTFTHDSGAATYTINQIDLVLRLKDAGPDPSQDLTISVRNTFTGTDIASGTISHDTLTTDYDWHSIDLDTDVVLNSNQTYYIVVTASSSNDAVEVGREHNNAFPNGELIEDDGDPKSGRDLLFRLLATNPNSDPQITSPTGGIAFINMDENRTLATTVEAQDPDTTDDTLTFSIVGGQDASAFTIDATSGELRFLTAPNFENPTDNFPTNGIYTVIVSVSDGRGGTDTQSISVVVRDVNDAPVTTGRTVTTLEDTEFAFSASDFSFSDQDGDALQSVTLSNLNLAGGTLTFNGGTVINSAITLTPAQLASVRYAPAANSSQSASFDFAVSDGSASSAIATMAIAVTPQNDAPVIDSVTGGVTTVFIDENQTFVTTVTTTDPDHSQTDLTYEIVAGASGSLFEIEAQTGVLSFRSPPDFENPSDIGAQNDYGVNVKVTDGDGASDTKGFIAIVQDVDELPVATGGAITTLEDTPVTFAVSDFPFTDQEGDDLESITVSNLNLAGGTLTLATGGTVTDGTVLNPVQVAQLVYTPAAGSSAPASFDYSVNNTIFGTVPAAMNIAVTAVNDAPVATGNAVALNEDTSFFFTATDFPFVDEDGDAMQSVTLTNLDLASGTLTHSGGTTVLEGTILTAAEVDTLVYRPAENANGTAGFSYTVNDSQAGAVSAPLTITVNAVNDDPVLNLGAGVAEFTVPEGQDFITTLTATDVETPASELRYIITGGASQSSFDLDPMTGELTFKEIPDFENPTDNDRNNDYSVRVTVRDTDGGERERLIIVDVTNVNELPEAQDVGVNTQEDTPHLFSVSDFAFTDADGDALQSITITNLNLAGGSLSHSSGTPVVDGTTVTAGEVDTLVFEPATNANGVASFTYTVNDDEQGTVSATMAITVDPVNDNPTFNAGTDPINFDIDENQTFIATVTATDVETPVADLRYSLVPGSSSPSFSINALTGDLSFNAAPDFEDPTDSDVNNIYGVEVLVRDSDGAETLQWVVVTVQDVNELPEAQGKTVNTPENTPFAFDLSDFLYTDPEGDALQSVTLTDLNLAGGALTILGGVAVGEGTTLSPGLISTLTYTPATGSSATASFNYSVNDAFTGVAKAPMIITVSEVNDPPVFAGGPTPLVVTVDENTTTIATLEATDPDTPDAQLRYSLVDGPMSDLFALDAISGELSFIDAPDFEAPAQDAIDNIYTAQVVVSDGQGGEAVQDVEITVANANDLPVALDNQLTTEQGVPVAFDVEDFTFSDQDGDAIQSATFTNLVLGGGALTHSNGVPVTDGATLSAAELASLVFSPATGSMVPASFDYTINDSGAGTSPARMVVAITPSPAVEVPQDTSFTPVGPVIIPEVIADPVEEAELETEEELQPVATSIIADNATAAPPPTVERTGVTVQPVRSPSQNITTPEAFLEVEDPTPRSNEAPLTPSTPLAIEPSDIDTSVQSRPFDFSALNRKAFTRDLDRTGEDIKQYKPLLEASAAKVAFAFGSALSVGSVSWLLRGGALAAVLMSSMPAWRRFDPIAVVSGHEDDVEDTEPTDLERMLQDVRDAGDRANDKAVGGRS